MKKLPIFVLALLAPMLMSIKPQSWGYVITDTWAPSGRAVFQTSENKQVDELQLSLKWYDFYLNDPVEEVFERLNSYEFNMALYKDATKIYRECESIGKIPSFYDDCSTAGVAEENKSIVFGFGIYNAKNIPRNVNHNFTIKMMKHPKETHGFKKGHPLEIEFYSEALKCLAQNPWFCGLDSYIKGSREHKQHVVVPENLKDTFAKYGVDGSTSWEGPAQYKVW